MPKRDVANRTAMVFLAFLPGLLAGCAAVTSPEPEPQAVAVPVSAPTTGVPAVLHFADGREGFVIHENRAVDAQSRAEFSRALALMDAGDFAQAAPLLEGVVARVPDLAAAHINLALAYVQLERPEAAEEQLKIALELVPDHPVAGNEYGLLLRRAGRFAEARAVYEQTLSSFPEYLPARRNLGILCDLYLDDPECALAQYETYSADAPEDEPVKLWIADLRIRLGKD